MCIYTLILHLYTTFFLVGKLKSDYSGKEVTVFCKLDYHIIHVYGPYTGHYNILAVVQ